jgi:phenylpropionate dioxygenase-like ring-hydroxylating dioxygenase large terminal subunit
MSASLESVFKGEIGELQRRVPVAERLTPEFYERERQKILCRSWVLIAHEVDVPEPGSYLVKDMPTFKTSVIIIRGLDGKVRTFHNACMHRGNKLVRAGQGCKKAFACGFHGWTYSPEGKLILVTDEHQFREIDKELLGLRPIHTDTWYGHIFVNFDREPRETLKEWLGELYGEYDGYFEQHELVRTNSIKVKCNWHLGVNSFTEGYHTMYIHRNSMPDYQGGRINPERHRPFMEMFKRHHRYSAPANPDHVWSKAETLAWKYGKQCIPAFDNDMTGLPKGINPSRYAHWAFDVVEVFPQTVFLFGNHWHIEIQFWPLDHETTEVVQLVYAYKPKNLGERISQEFWISRGRQVVLEDLNTLEAQQEMLASGAVTHVQLSMQEMSLQHHYRVCNVMMAQN